MWLFDKLNERKKEQEEAEETARLEAERQAAIKKELLEAQKKAAEEMLIQGFQHHRAQMCMLINKPALLNKNEPHIVEAAMECAKQAAIIANRIDDNGTLELFADEVGKPHVIEISNREDDAKIIASIESQNAPTLAQHFKNISKHFYPNGATPESCAQSVFCTMVTAGIDQQEYDAIKDAMDDFFNVPFFLKIINLSGPLTHEEYEAFGNLDDHAAEKLIDNIDVIHIKEGNELTYKKLLNEYKGFVANAFIRKILTGEPGFDAKAVDINAEGRAKSGL